MILSFGLQTGRETLPIQVSIRNLVIAGWTGRDRTAVDAHIKELAEIGVAPPARVPVFYRASASLLTQADAIQVLGCGSTGEVEFVLIQDSERLLVGLGSDHTDRKAETIAVSLAKQMCPKPLGSSIWEFGAVEPHWDELIFRSYILEGGRRILYQQGSAAAILHPRNLIEPYAGGGGLQSGTVMYCGTVPAIGGVRWTGEFCMELEDPVAQRKIVHQYAIEPLPAET